MDRGAGKNCTGAPQVETFLKNHINIGLFLHFSAETLSVTFQGLFITGTSWPLFHVLDLQDIVLPGVSARGLSLVLDFLYTGG